MLIYISLYSPWKGLSFDIIDLIYDVFKEDSGTIVFCYVGTCVCTPTCILYKVGNIHVFMSIPAS